jgi:hypothetical protein
MAVYTKGFKTSNTMDGSRFKTTIYLESVNGEKCKRKIDVDIKINVAGFYQTPASIEIMQNKDYDKLIEEFEQKSIIIKNILEYYEDDFGRKIIAYESMCDNRIRIASLYPDANGNQRALMHDSFTGFIKTIEQQNGER